jgi:hypothetical protein
MPTDDDLLAQLQDLLAEDDPVPPSVVSAARDSLDWLSIDTELACLVADSLLVTAEVRGDSTRLLTYQVDDDTVIEVEVTEINGRLRIIGQLVPPMAARVRAEHPGGGVEVHAGRLGRFTAEDVLRGPTRFMCTPVDDDGVEAGPPVLTEWILL